MPKILLALAAAAWAVPAAAATPTLELTTHWAGYLSLAVFVVAYMLVVFEETLHLRKSKPVLVGGGIIWALIGIAYAMAGQADLAHELAREMIGEYGELFLFLFVAISYVNTMEERRIFDALRDRLVGRGMTYRQIFWLVGILAFLFAGVLDNLTTALIMGTVVIAIGGGAPRFVIVGCVSVVVAANAGGAFSPFGNITTLMVWQKGKLALGEFFTLFFPALVNWLVPAAIMAMAIPAGRPEARAHQTHVKPGAYVVIALFAATIATAVSFKNFLHMPPAIGMMLGLGYLQIFSFFQKRRGGRRGDSDMVLDSFAQFQRVEWDTLLFFFGIMFAVGGLGIFGYLALASNVLYVGLGATAANVIIGIVSAVVDNIPLMYAVLLMNPQMADGQWLLITLTCGVGGSILSIGSAAGVALMGQARGYYTFVSHLRWAWAISLGYAASILAHLWLNAHLF